MFILRKSCAAIVLGSAVLCSALAGAPVAAAEELPCPASDLGQTVVWDYYSYAICDNGWWTVRPCEPGEHAIAQKSGNAFCG